MTVMLSHYPITIFSGGSAANSLVDVFSSISHAKSCPLTYIIPISDNGGSTSELIRVFGGPGIGDVRSRLVRLIPRLPSHGEGTGESEESRERESIRDLFNHRMSARDTRLARAEWNEIVDGTSPLWRHISSAKKELIRSIFNTVNLEIIKRSRPPSSTFDFTCASVGNLFLTGARLFTGSFESAIYLLSSICGIKDEEVKVVPSINSNFSHHIAAGLENGSVIVGQNSISHPSTIIGVGAAARRPGGRSSNVMSRLVALRSDTAESIYKSASHESASEPPNGAQLIASGAEGGGAHASDDFDGAAMASHPLLEHDTVTRYGISSFPQDSDHEEEDANLPGSLPTLRTKNITFSKDAHSNEELPARISRIWYINPYGQEILPPANPRAIAAISNAQAIIYSIGSLYTSLVPNLVLRGVGDALRKTNSGAGRPRAKILILNGSLDREVGPQYPTSGSSGSQFSAVDFVKAIVKAGEQSRGVVWEDEDTDLTDKDEDKVETRSDENAATSSSATSTNVSTRHGNNITHPTPATSSRPLASRAHSYQSPNLYPPPLLASTSPTRDPSPESSPSPSPNPYLRRTTSSTSTTGPAAPGPDPIYKLYVTHMIHLPNAPGTPHVDKDLLLSRYGIQCIRVYGRSVAGEEGMRYDAQALRGAIEAIVGPRSEGGIQNTPGSRDIGRGRHPNGGRHSNTDATSASGVGGKSGDYVPIDHLPGSSPSFSSAGMKTVQLHARRNTVNHFEGLL